MKIKGKRKELTGIVKSDKMEKTISVQVVRTVRHPMYGKIIRRRAKFMAHDESGQAKAGDTVRIRESRPLSKNKRWRLIEVTKKSSRQV